MILFFINTTQDVPIPEWMLNPWFLCTYGWILYNVFNINYTKDKYDRDKSGYLSGSEFWFYLKVNLWAIIFSILLIPAGVFLGPDLWDAFVNLFNWEWGANLPIEAKYIIMGCLSPILQFAIKKIFSK